MGGSTNREGERTAQIRNIFALISKNMCSTYYANSKNRLIQQSIGLNLVFNFLITDFKIEQHGSNDYYQRFCPFF